MVDAERIGARLNRLDGLLQRLEAIHEAGEEAYIRDERVRAMTERWLQLAIQVCIDVATQLVGELAVDPPDTYGGIFRSLAAAGHIDADLAEQMARAAGQRNLLVHAYLELDDHEVFATLARLDDLRAFAAAAQRLADST